MTLDYVPELLIFFSTLLHILNEKAPENQEPFFRLTIGPKRQL